MPIDYSEALELVRARFEPVCAVGAPATVAYKADGRIGFLPSVEVAMDDTIRIRPNPNPTVVPDRWDERIRATFEAVIAEGLRRDSVRGASDDQIDRFAAEQGVGEVPAAVRAVLRLVGDRPGRWFAGTAFGVHDVDSSAKRHAVALLADVEHLLRDPEDMLVLSAHQGYVYQFIYGNDLTRDDPPVWEIEEGAGINGGRKRVSQWFDATRPGVCGGISSTGRRGGSRG
ncbi:hypothetical protein [Nocardia sp. NPDC057353]|uniref:hypothetical protein n=1 Tax=Nocardia sp. NPDC057353 TaxID=3346104 RepID=UPI00363CE3ED